MELAFQILRVTAAVVFLFGITILAHEFGHFLAARLCGMAAEVFSIGFGPTIWKRKYRGVLYKIGVLPIGGYVALPQMEPAEGQPSGAVEERPAPLPPAHPVKKIIVSLAGGAGNLLLAFALAWIVYKVGKPASPAELRTVIGHVEPDSAAYAAGLRPGHEITAVNGEPVANWTEFLQTALRFEDVALSVATPEGPREFALPTETRLFGIRAVAGISEENICKVMLVNAGSPAEQAGILPGDIITHFDGARLFSFQQLVDLTRNRAGDQIELMLRRRGAEFGARVVPRFDEVLGRAVIGIQWDPEAADEAQLVHVPPMLQVRRYAGAIFRVVRSLLTPREAGAASRAIGGPLIVIYMFQEMVRRGVMIALAFTCFLNVNLAILNLLPLPVLDGGHVLFSLLELAFRRPLPAAVMRHITNAFAALLIGVIVLLTGRDALRLKQIFSWSFSEPASNAAPARAPEPP